MATSIQQQTLAVSKPSSMNPSNKGKAIPSVARANHILAGAKSTRKARRQHASAFLSWCSKQGEGLPRLQDASKELVIKYLHYRQHGNPAAGVKAVSIGTLRNIQSSLNAMINLNRAASDARRLTSFETGLPMRSRIGKKRPITDAEFAAAIEKALVIGEPGFVLMLQLERYLGLRGQEALMIWRALQRFQIAKAARGQAPERLEVLEGTKGGRYRAIEFIEAKRDQTLEFLDQAFTYASQNDQVLLKGKKATLLSARTRYTNLCQKIGLVGEIAPHSLRYAYATEKLTELHASGMTRKQASQWVAMNLGHGTSRDRFVRSVYGRSVGDGLK